MKASRLLQEFTGLLSGELVADIELIGVASPEAFGEFDIVISDSEAKLKQLTEQKISPGLVITTVELAKQLLDGYSVFTTKNPRLAHVFIKQRLNDFLRIDPDWERIHPSAIIHPATSISDSCHIGPHVVIGSNVTLGENTVVRSHAVIEHDVVVGKNCTIYSHANIAYGSQIGDRVILRSGAVIGGEGFGYAKDENKQYHRVPHTGYVELQDDVHIGSNCNIDRGTYGATLIKRGSKLDSLCHIAHNVVIGENCIVTSQCVIAGSTVIGDRVILSGQTGVLDHLNIADDVVLVHRAGVISDIAEKGMWAGLPSRPLKEHMKNLSAEKRLSNKIAKLEKRLSELEDK